MKLFIIYNYINTQFIYINIIIIIVIIIII